ncbi:hypothetical protein ACH5RR_037019 [Cinchona calisaya]|uniref:Uncharacterized protein n=1 Tax=Cinchona calisaya TaxID=153742 RepID=A0ABD2Y9S4_9GENT
MVQSIPSEGPVLTQIEESNVPMASSAVEIPPTVKVIDAPLLVLSKPIAETVTPQDDAQIIGASQGLSSSLPMTPQFLLLVHNNALDFSIFAMFVYAKCTVVECRTLLNELHTLSMGISGEPTTTTFSMIVIGPRLLCIPKWLIWSPRFVPFTLLRS